jgi:hypothetical protein
MPTYQCRTEIIIMTNSAPQPVELRLGLNRLIQNHLDSFNRHPRGVLSALLDKQGLHTVHLAAQSTELSCYLLQDI